MAHLKLDKKKQEVKSIRKDPLRLGAAEEFQKEELRIARLAGSEDHPILID